MMLPLGGPTYGASCFLVCLGPLPVAEFAPDRLIRDFDSLWDAVESLGIASP